VWGRGWAFECANVNYPDLDDTAEVVMALCGELPFCDFGEVIDPPSADVTAHEPEFAGTGFPGDFYIKYHLYGLTFSVMALGRYLRGDA